MAHSGATTVVSAIQAATPQKPKPVIGETRDFLGGDGHSAFSVAFKDGSIVITKLPEGVPDVSRTIVPKYGNVRLVEGQMHQVADLALEFLFNIKDTN